MQRVLREILGGNFEGVAPQRTRHMQSIRSTGNRSTERRLRGLLIQAKVRGWTVHPKDVPGTPEFAFRAEKVAVFTDGCFWHGCPRCGKSPRTNSSYWSKKIQLNVERDRKDEAALRAQGFRFIRLWEHEIRENPADCVRRIRTLLARSRPRRKANGRRVIPS
jgi:DNA mismatch endonuclease (patch repair protein)